MKFLLPFLLLPLLALTALCLGDVPTPLSEVWHVLTGQASPDNLASFIILQVRLPQMLTALLCGCSLAAAGLVMQTVFPIRWPTLRSWGSMREPDWERPLRCCSWAAR